MSIFSLSFVGVLAAGIGFAAASATTATTAPSAPTATMTDAFERGDLDEATRQGAIAGPVVVEAGLGSASRSVQLASIASAPFVEDRAELLSSLATVAANPDRRTAIPAATSARAIARELTKAELPDDIDDDDLATWRARYEAIAANRNHFIEVRVLALDTIAALGHVDIARALEDPDADFRTAAVAVVPVPTPDPLFAPLAKAIREDADVDVVRTAALALCEQKDKAVALLGAQGLDRLKKLAPKSRCLAK
jgi:hypothetical protein